MDLQKSKLFIFITGCLMGAADIVPGVSGGTVAFISGIYQRLINALKEINPKILLTIKNSGIAKAWQQIDGNFLLVLFSGVLLSVFSLAHVVSYMLTNFPIITWSVFFSLIFASSIHMIRKIQAYNLVNILTLILGAATAYCLSVMLPLHLAATPMNLFVSGAIAICAMILPGISGSFILLLLGIYPEIIVAVKELDIILLAIFASGCIVGILTFSQVLSWLLKCYHALTLSFLTGLMIGALAKVWPWKQHATDLTIKAIKVQPNLSPWSYQQLTGNSNQLGITIAIFLVTLLVMVIFEIKASKQQ
jgi:putative membrane protein